MSKAYIHVHRDIADLVDLGLLADAYTAENPGKQMFQLGDIILLGDGTLVGVDGTNSFDRLLGPAS